MTSLVEALRRKYEKLTQCHIFESFVQTSPNRTGANILFPARSLSMDSQQISKIGNVEELLRAAGHVAELDLAGNKISCWREIFILLCCLRNLESLNLSRNPLGPTAFTDSPGPSSFHSDDDEAMSKHLPDRTPDHFVEGSSGTVVNGLGDVERSEPVQMRSTGAARRNGSPLLRFAAYEPINEARAGEMAGIEPLDSDLSKLSSFSEHGSQVDDLMVCCHGQNGMTEGSSSESSPPVESAFKLGLLTPTTTFPQLTVLAVNATFIPWVWVLDLVRLFPSLHTLHVALNNYGADEACLEGSGDTFDAHQPLSTTTVFPSLRTLYYSDNGISSWWTACRLGRSFPRLEQLVLLGNPLTHIPTPLPSPMSKRADRFTHDPPSSSVVVPKGASSSASSSSSIVCTPQQTPTVSRTATVTKPFANVHTVGLSETLINRWESVDALGEWMPKLTNLRLGNTLPVFQSWPESDCRAHVIARLPNLTTYNRSAIDTEERETAEREFVRHYGQSDPNERPNRYWELERRHGRLEPLADIDLSPKRFVRVRVIMDGKETVHELNLSLKVSQAKRQFLNLFDVDPSGAKRYRLFYFDQVMSESQGPEELKFPTRALHSYQPEPGDLFELIRLPDRNQSSRTR